MNLEVDKDERYWEQRARANWLKAGDKNTSFFHKYASQRRSKNRIKTLISNESREIIDEIGMHALAREYFSNLFSSNGPCDASHILEGVKRVITTKMNNTLLEKFKEEEVWEDLKDMGLIKASRDEGFPVIFFQKFWHIIGKDITRFRLQVLNEGMNFEKINSTSIFLLPKIPHPTSLVNFRPISLCNILYKNNS